MTTETPDMADTQTLERTGERGGHPVTPLIDRTFYVVICDFWQKPCRENRYQRRYRGFEAIVDERCMTREQVVQGLADEEWSDPVQIIEVNTGESTAHDVSRLIALDVEEELAKRGVADLDMPGWIWTVKSRGPKERQVA